MARTIHPNMNRVILRWRHDGFKRMAAEPGVIV
jgi:hypothetical protein